MSGKGSERRKGANDDAYRSGYDRIFGAKPKPNTEAVIPASVKQKKERKEKGK